MPLRVVGVGLLVKCLQRTWDVKVPVDSTDLLYPANNEDGGGGRASSDCLLGHREVDLEKTPI